MQRSFYQVLGVPRDASPAQIRSAYVRLVKRHHPDVVGHIPDRLGDVLQAYRCLADPVRRLEHDTAIRAGERLHLERQRSVQRRLGRYDHRHPHRPPQVARPRRWRPVAAAAAVGAFLIVHLSRLWSA